MSKDFSQMTAAELRTYAETVQAEYDADELSGPSGRQIVRDAWERVAEAELAELIQHQDKMAKEIDNDLAIALALTYQKILASRKAPRDTTPLSAEAWEAMHGIGQESMQDERPIMMIQRQIVNYTAGYVGRTAYDSVKVWRLYATPSGEVWGAEWSHGTEWRESTWGSMQHVQKFITATAELNDVVAEWERY